MTIDHTTWTDAKHHMDDFERGYAKGYERALQQLVEHLEFDIASPLVMAYVRAAAEKLRREVLND